MTVRKHALADPNYLLEITAFYWDMVVDKGIDNKARNVHQWARSKAKPQMDTAQAVAALVRAEPPSATDFRGMREYFLAKVLSNIPKPFAHDDVFWCCFLTEIDNSDIPECSFGGPLHKMVYKVYDDFDPDDVTL